MSEDLQTLEIALGTLLEARDDSDIDETTPTVFMAPDGTEYRLGMFELCQCGDIDDERLVVDLIPVVDPQDRIATLEEFASRVRAGLDLSNIRTRDGWTQDAVKWLDSQTKGPHG